MSCYNTGIRTVIILVYTITVLLWDEYKISVKQCYKNVISRVQNVLFKQVSPVMVHVIIHLILLLYF